MNTTTTSSLEKLIEAGIQNFLQNLPDSGLYDPVRYVLNMEGKRIRPRLCLMGCQLVNGDVQSAIAPALSLELLHNFTLVHDDIMDKAPLRRGNSTVHTQWNQNTAILSGDALMIKAYQQIEKAGDDVLPEVMRLFNQTALEVCEGQQLDMEFEERTAVSRGEYLEMIRLKTSVLIGCALQMGVLMAPGDRQQARTAYRFGENLGMAFQIMDDWLDAFGNSAKVGKRKGGDIISGKHTLLHIDALKLAGETKRKELDELYAACRSGAEKPVAQVIDLYTRLGVKQRVKQQMEQYYNRALSELKTLDVDANKKEELRGFARELFNRDH